jgi:hypothetical protein
VLDVTNGGAVNAGGGTTVGPNGTIMGDGTITTPTLINNGTVTPTAPNGIAGTLTSSATKNAFLVPTVDPNLTDLIKPVEVWFSLANTQRFNIQNRLDDIIAGSTGFVSNVTYPKPPPNGKELVEGKGVLENGY